MGMEACRIIKNRPEWETIPIIMLTATEQMLKILEVWNMEQMTIYTKPFASSELVARVKAVLRRRGWETSKNVLTITSDFRMISINLRFI